MRISAALSVATNPGPPWQHDWFGPWSHDALWPLGAALFLGDRPISEPGKSWNPSTPKGPSGIRTSDHERDATVRVLSHAIADGRLNFQEGEDRIQSAYTARYREDLVDLVKDLPI